MLDCGKLHDMKPSSPQSYMILPSNHCITMDRWTPYHPGAIGYAMRSVAQHTDTRCIIGQVMMAYGDMAATDGRPGYGRVVAPRHVNYIPGFLPLGLFFLFFHKTDCRLRVRAREKAKRGGVLPSERQMEWMSTCPTELGWRDSWGLCPEHREPGSTRNS